MLPPQILACLSSEASFCSSSPVLKWSSKRFVLLASLHNKLKEEEEEVEEKKKERKKGRGRRRRGGGEEGGEEGGEGE